MSFRDQRELVLDAIAEARARIAPQVRVSAVLTDASDLVEFCRAMECVDLGRGLQTEAPPLQLSPGRLTGLVLKLRFARLNFFYAVCDRDVVFPDLGNFCGAGIAEMAGGYGGHWHQSGIFSPRAAGMRSVRVSVTQAGAPPARRAHAAPPGLPSAAAFFGALEGIADLARARRGGEDLVVAGSALNCVLQGFEATLTAAPMMQAPQSTAAKLCELARARPRIGMDAAAAELMLAPRTLHARISRDAGAGPKKLLQRIKLRDVALSMPAAARAGQPIGDLAFAHGFDDFARFCADYRALYGERAGETMRRYA